jgi:RNA polymerase sigma factor (sigma-70 family)
MENGASSYRRFLEGDESAFGEIIDMYREGLIFFINRFVRNISVAEELSEDVFLELLIHKHRYNFKNSLKTYLYAIGRHKALDYIRKLARRDEVLFDESVHAAQAPDLDEIFLTGERSRQLHEAIDKLKDDYRTVLHLLYFEDMSAEQAGKVMKKNRKQIENLSYRAKKALKNAMEKEGFCYEEQGRLS